MLRFELLFVILLCCSAITTTATDEGASFQPRRLENETLGTGTSNTTDSSQNVADPMPATTDNTTASDNNANDAAHSPIGVSLSEMEIKLRSASINFVQFGEFLEAYLFNRMSAELNDLVEIDLKLKSTGRRLQRQLQTTATLTYVGLARFGAVADNLEAKTHAAQAAALEDVDAFQAAVSAEFPQGVEIVEIAGNVKDTFVPTMAPTTQTLIVPSGAGTRYWMGWIGASCGVLLL